MYYLHIFLKSILSVKKSSAYLIWDSLMIDLNPQSWVVKKMKATRLILKLLSLYGRIQYRAAVSNTADASPGESNLNILQTVYSKLCP